MSWSTRQIREWFFERIGDQINTETLQIDGSSATVVVPNFQENKTSIPRIEVSIPVAMQSDRSLKGNEARVEEGEAFITVVGSLNSNTSGTYDAADRIAGLFQPGSVATVGNTKIQVLTHRVRALYIDQSEVRLPISIGYRASN